jgi:hypothetical protein
MAQQNAATTPKLMNTMAATNCKQKEEGVDCQPNQRCFESNPESQLDVRVLCTDCHAPPPPPTQWFTAQDRPAQPDPSIWVHFVVHRGVSMPGLRDTWGLRKHSSGCVHYSITRD